MPPQITTLTTRASARLGPWIITAFDKKILENNRKKDYHSIILVGSIFDPRF